LLLALLQFFFGVGEPTVSAAPYAQTQDAPRVAEVTLLTPQVARFEKFEAMFQVETAAKYLNLPYDANPPPGIAPGQGVSVDVLFSADDWKTTIVQPAFFFQPVKFAPTTRRNYLLPEGAPSWRVRWTPQTAGIWQFRIRVQDRNGTTVYPANDALALRVTENAQQGADANALPASHHGFLRVSAQDARYFEFQDGAPFIGLGYNVQKYRVQEIDALFREWEQNGLNFARMWLSSAGINGAQERPWQVARRDEFGGNLNELYDWKTTFADEPLSYRLDEKLPCMFGYFGESPIAVKPNTTYSITLHVKLTNVIPLPNATSAGLTVMEGGWPSKGCAGINSRLLVIPRVGTTDWYTTTGTLTTRADQSFLDFLYIILQNTASGRANIDSIALTERDDPMQINLLRRGRASSHLYFDSVNAAKWDAIIASAEQHGVYLKLVIDEKNDWIRNILQADGTFGQRDNNNFYAAPNTAVRWLQEAWWRYVIARWGYSTAIHSFEYVNEGDPYNGNHYRAAAAMARYFDANDSAQHMVTTSMWHSFPATRFWNNPEFQAIDYADLHAYTINNIDSDTAEFPAANLETRRQFVHSGSRALRIPAVQEMNLPLTPRGLALDEPGEWVIRYWLRAKDFKSDCEANSQGSMLRVRWMLDDGAFYGGAEGVVPAATNGKDFLCTTPDGTFAWREFSSQQNRAGQTVPLEQRLVITDTRPHELMLYLQNAKGARGEAWIDDVQIISPSGKRVPTLGTFEPRNFTQDTAWFTAAYSLLRGVTSPVGVHKPLVRGEAGLNNSDFPDGLFQVNQDQQGVWLHNFVWGQINSGGMYDLLWWGEYMIEDNPSKGRNGNLFGVFARFADFMRDIPLNNGAYRDANAVASDPRLRVWGQRDDQNGRAHLWIQNTNHTWTNIIAGQTIQPISGTITIANFKPGSYTVTWWNTTEQAPLQNQTVRVTDKGILTLTLPAPLATDVAVKIRKNQE